jgi:hypothetical protein
MGVKNMLTGWGKKGRPFSKKEFDNSYLKKNNKMSYKTYLEKYARIVVGKKSKPKKRNTKPKIEKWSWF